MKTKENKTLKYVKIKDEFHTELKKKAIDCKKSLQDFIDIIIENFLKNNLTQVTN